LRGRTIEREREREREGERETWERHEKRDENIKSNEYLETSIRPFFA
jgi:hypothetical protein